MQKRQFITMLSGAMLTGVSGLVRAQGAGTPGVTDREIKIGSTGPQAMASSARPCLHGLTWSTPRAA